MRVFYYQYEGKTHLVSVPGTLDAGRKSPIWNCNSCSWLVPSTYDISLPDEDSSEAPL